MLTLLTAAYLAGGGVCCRHLRLHYYLSNPTAQPPFYKQYRDTVPLSLDTVTSSLYR